MFQDISDGNGKNKKGSRQAPFFAFAARSVPHAESEDGGLKPRRYASCSGSGRFIIGAAAVALAREFDFQK